MADHVEEILRWIAIVILLCCSAMFSGLNLGLMGLDSNGLEIIIAGGSEKDKKYAKIIAPVRAKGNMLLCTLLLGNVAVNTALSILMADLTDGTVGFVVSTLLIVILGEIIPQAACSRHPLAIGAATIWPVKIIMAIMFVFTWPLSKGLDYVLGQEMGTMYNKQEFKKLVEMHVQGTQIRRDEANIMKGALDLGIREIKDVMTPIDKVYMLEARRLLDVNTLSEIWKSGYSRIPVFDGTKGTDNIVGIIHVKDLILIDPADCTPLSQVLQFYSRPVPYQFPDCKLREALNEFKSGKSHLAIVHDVIDDGFGDPHYKNVGLVTLEDILETIIQSEIADEHDAGEGLVKQQRSYVDNLGLWSRRKMPRFVTPQEGSAIYFHLSGTVDVLRVERRLIPEPVLKRLIMDSHVVNVEVPEERRSHTTSALTPSPSPDAHPTDLDVEQGGVYLYRAGVPSEYFTLVLDGTVEIRAGKQGFVSELGRWSILCADALESLAIDPSRCAYRAGETKTQSLPSTPSSEEPSFHFQSQDLSAELAKANVAPQHPYVPDFTARCLTNARLLRIHRMHYLLCVYGVTCNPSAAPRTIEPPAAVSVVVHSLAPTRSFSVPTPGGSRPVSPSVSAVDPAAAAVALARASQRMIQWDEGDGVTIGPRPSGDRQPMLDQRERSDV